MLARQHVFENGVENKWCGYCKTFLPLDDFCIDRNRGDGRSSRCRKCVSKIKKMTRSKTILSERSWVKRNPDRVKAYKKKYRDTHPETMKAIYNRRAAKLLSTLDGRLNNNMRVAMKYSLRNNKNGLHWESLVPYTLEELKIHLESQFKEGMNWGNHAKYGWHIDHVRPICSFNIASPDDPDFKKCWDLSNLRPLWWDENLKKNGKVL